MRALTASPITVLVVLEPETSSLFCEHSWKLLQMLRLAGFDVQPCHAACAALQQAEHLGASLILQSMHMQGAHGLDMLRLYQQHPLLSAIPVVLLDAAGSPVLQRYALLRGASGVWNAVPDQAMLVHWVNFYHRHYLLKTELVLTQKRLNVSDQSLQKCRAQLQQASSLDSLTGLPNRQYFTSMYEREWSRALRETEPLSLMLIDMDFFKSYNDRYGHAQGDLSLQEVALLLPRLLKRPTDFCGRYSGAAFMVVLPMTHAKGGIQLAERIRHAVLDLQIPHQGSEVEHYLTVSIGLATTCPMLKHGPRDLIRVVDHARFDAKLQGRNRLICKSL